MDQIDFPDAKSDTAEKKSVPKSQSPSSSQISTRNQTASGNHHERKRKEPVHTNSDNISPYNEKSYNENSYNEILNKGYDTRSKKRKEENNTFQHPHRPPTPAGSSSTSKNESKTLTTRIVVPATNLVQLPAPPLVQLTVL